jgi:hypothetical protein
VRGIGNPEVFVSGHHRVDDDPAVGCLDNPNLKQFGIGAVRPDQQGQVLAGIKARMGFG